MQVSAPRCANDLSKIRDISGEEKHFNMLLSPFHSIQLFCRLLIPHVFFLSSFAALAAEIPRQCAFLFSQVIFMMAYSYGVRFKVTFSLPLGPIPQVLCLRQTRIS